jgi:N-acetylneuraminic acid mutarotase
MNKVGVLLIVGCIFLLFVCMFHNVSGFQADTWVSKASMNHARAYLGTAVVNGKIFAIGGDEGSEMGNCMTGTSMTSNVVNYTEEYDPVSNVWVEKAAMPTSRAQFGTAVFQNKIYCIGGYNGANVPQNDSWRTEYYTLSNNEAYDPTTNTWTRLASMPTPRYSAATNIVNGVIYVMGGHTMTDLYTTYNLTEVYNPQTNTWTTKKPSPLPISSPASAVIDDKIFVLGDLSYPNYDFVLMVYDPASDSWTIGDKAPVRYAATSVSTNDVNAAKRIYLFDENRTDIYNPVTNNWSTGNSAPTDRLIAKAAILDDTIYLIGGRTGQWGYMTFMYPSPLNEQYIPLSCEQSNEPESESTSPSNTAIAPTNIESASPSGNLQAEKQNATSPFWLTTPMIAIFCVCAVFFLCLGLVLYARKHKLR